MKKLLIYGGTSSLSIEFMKKFNNEIDIFIVIGRNQKKFDKQKLNLDEVLSNKIKFYQLDLLDLKNNLAFSNSLENNSFDGLFFVMGETGDPIREIKILNNVKIIIILT